MSSKQQGEPVEQSYGQEADAQATQPGTSPQAPATEQLMSTLNQVFAAFAQRAQGQSPEEFNTATKDAAKVFHDIVERLQFRIPS